VVKSPTSVLVTQRSRIRVPPEVQNRCRVITVSKLLALVMLREHHGANNLGLLRPTQPSIPPGQVNE